MLLHIKHFIIFCCSNNCLIFIYYFISYYGTNKYYHAVNSESSGCQSKELTTCQNWCQVSVSITNIQLTTYRGKLTS